MHHALRTSCLVALALVSLAATASAQLHPTGLLWEDPRNDARLVETTPPVRKPDIALTLPASVDNSAPLPPVRSQGSQGSCVGWGVGYYMKTYQEWQEHGWDTNDTANQFSPAFIYNQINGGRDGGAFFSDALDLVLNHGCCSWQLMPYNQSDYVSWPSESAYENALPHRALETHYLNVRSESGINTLKQHLADGNVAVLGISVYPNFDNISSYSYNYCVADMYGTSRGGHAVTFCGYDDNRATHDGPGAFRLVNSWGAGWGASGYFWMSYAAVKDVYLSQGYAYYWTDRIGYEPILTARFKITHFKRDRISLTMGVEVDGTSQTKNFLGYMWPGIDRPFPNNNIVFDLSEWAADLDPNQINRIFLTCQDSLADGISGTIDSFQSEYQTWGFTASCGDTPAAIPDSSSSVTVNTYMGAGLPRAIYVDAANQTGIENGTPQHGYLAIQSGIGAAVDGDTVIVLPGTYHENVQISGKRIVLQSYDTPSRPGELTTFIDGGDAGPAVSFDGTESPDTVLDGFTITNGSAASGGGIAGSGTHASIIGCIVTANTGGGISGCDGTITRCVVTDNQTSGDGGGIASCAADLIGCIVANNSARYGGGLYNVTGAVGQSTIADNNADVGGGLHGCTGSLTGSIIYRNTAPVDPQLHACSAPYYCCIEGWAGSGQGNLSVDPVLTATYRLAPYSPCINAGDPNAGDTDLYDIDDEPRVLYGRADIGADEVSRIAGDFEPDGDVDSADLATMVDEFSGPDPAPAYLESGGMVVIEAEHYDHKVAGSGPAAGATWVDQTGNGSMGDGYVEVLPDVGLAIDAPDIELYSPHLRYTVQFNTIGIYYLWLRGQSQIDDTVHFGLDGVPVSSDHDTAALCDWDLFYWWSELGQYEARPVVPVAASGQHIVDIWMRDDGPAIDRLLLTTSESYLPPQDGPPESPSTQFNLTADLDGDNDVDLADLNIFARNFTGP